ncbi:hypothetical protein N7492_008871 [Penicillium capsulatum]|uniref:RING-type E3 ubiquitin transferase n=1 Tax=Penicillium capsulatum TaxID=69766 RepID=A0A9W9HQJ3_9EURO|nr:hypothetical protein N7492_008871 [Penicillium capsulatum]KAJ6106273.1 hypothetical protein N7512_009790 [Penicillium capsulatum]
MQPPRLLLILFCLIFFPILLTFFSAIFSSNVATPSTLAGPTSGLHALFSFNIPTSLFPPSAIISLTDDNSTFFLARPAAFGPLLPGKGLSGELWVGSGFGEGGLAAGIEGELGCSDIPGWGEGTAPKKPEMVPRGTDLKSGKSGSGPVNDMAQNRLPAQAEASRQSDKSDSAPPSNDGTDDHLHHPLPESSVSDTDTSRTHGEHAQAKHPAHADIQSLQEAAEIQGKVVLLTRGGCGFLEKVKWAQRRGAVALIVGDDTRGGNLVTMYARGDTSNVTIPSLFTSHTTAHLLSSLIPAHSGANSDLGEALKSLQAKLASQGNVDIPKPATTTSTVATSTPTSTGYLTKERPDSAAASNGGFFRALGSLFGLCSRHGGPKNSEDSRRPPSSGNLDWMGLGSRESTGTKSGVSKTSNDYPLRSRGKTSHSVESNKAVSVPENADGDGFVIGVQDWRDPDVLPLRSSDLPLPSTSATGKDSSKTAVPETGAASTPNVLRGGSITPGSGEYLSIDKNTGHVHDSTLKEPEKDVDMNHGASKSKANEKSWFSSHFRWSDDHKQIQLPSPSIQTIAASQKTPGSTQSSAPPATMFSEHEGLWVTLTPTSMSTSPFFDTLLVLVVSPLLTLTVVYALLLLRSRIRRRRWRAPKSVIERLPVRTYHTISSTTSSSSSPRSTSPGAVSPTSPLLGSESRSRSSRSIRPRSQTIAGVPLDPEMHKEEKSTSPQVGSTLWRRKYTGRQVECVVCLEEYVDGQSRVMSLPCGHEFHAECITPWLTTRRRTCPICKGDVVRSMSHSQGGELHYHGDLTHAHSHGHGAHSDPASVPLLIAEVNNDADTEQNAGLEGQTTSAPASSWRYLASFSLSALSGDTIWHQARADRNR